MYLFLFRRYNDIDHIVPLVYRMAHEGIREIRLLCMTPNLGVKDDFRIQFLEKQLGIPTRHAYQAYAPTVFHKIIAWLACRPFITDQNLNELSFWKRAKIRINNFLAKNVSLKANAFGKRYFFHEIWAKNLIADINPSVLILDHQQAAGTALALITACHENGGTVIAVPHGVNLMTNEDSILDKKTGLPRLPSDFGPKWKEFDHVIVNSHSYKDLVVRNGAPPGKVSVI